MLNLPDVLRLQAHSDETGGQVSEAGQVGDHAERERRSEGPGAVKNPVEETMSKDLHSLRIPDGLFAVMLNALQIVNGDGAGA